MVFGGIKKEFYIYWFQLKSQIFSGHSFFDRGKVVQQVGVIKSQLKMYWKNGLCVLILILIEMRGFSLTSLCVVKWSFILNCFHSSVRVFSGLVCVNGYLYAIGGYDGTTQLSSMECYNIARNVWEPRASMHFGRSAHGATVYQSCIFVLGQLCHIVICFTKISKR